MRNKGKSLILNLITFSLKLLRKSRVARYSCKHSNHLYTQHQHIALLILKTYLRQDYRGFCEIVQESGMFLVELGLNEVPHFTTLQKFMHRFNPMAFERLVYEAIGSYESNRVAIDATGFSSSYASTYYVERLRGETETRSFMKASIAIDLEKQMVISLKLRKGPSNDSPDFIPLLEKVEAPLLVVADKGYDAEKNLEYLKRHCIHAAIPVKLGHNAPRHTKLRKRMKWWFERNPVAYDIYHERSKVEAVFSAVKRKFGDVLHSRSTVLRKKEVKLKFLVYNIYRRCVFCMVVLGMVSTRPQMWRV